MHKGDVNEAASTAKSPSLADDPPDSGSNFEQLSVSEDPAHVRSMLDFCTDPGVRVRPNGLVLPEGLSFDSWRELGCQVVRVANCSAWWLGDWLLYGEREYGDRYKQTASETSLSYQTLRNYAWVARKFPVSRRQDTLSFGHHAEVAALPDDEQEAWLARAKKLNWSCSQLRRQMRAEQLANRHTSGASQPHIRSLKIDVLADRHDRWQSAAERTNCTMADWIITTLDRVASELQPKPYS